VLRVFVALAAAVLAAGCGGGGSAEDTAKADAPTAARPVAAGTPAREPGRVLLRFVRAARQNDADTMWRLLSGPTRASIGPTLARFRSTTAREFHEGLGTLDPGATVILSRRLGQRWAVAAVAGTRSVEGEREDFAYGAALTRERGVLRLELGGAVVSGQKPEPADRVSEARPEVAANVSAGGIVTRVLTWLDGTPFSATRGVDDLPFTATLRGRPARPLARGRHHVVVFASTDRAAVASAWTFTVV
jgi:hypothetical protein